MTLGETQSKVDGLFYQNNMPIKIVVVNNNDLIKGERT
jgi:hypothetical protein